MEYIYHDRTPGGLETSKLATTRLLISMLATAPILRFFPPTSQRSYIAPSLSLGYSGGNDPEWQGQRYCPNASASGTSHEVDLEERNWENAAFGFLISMYSLGYFILFHSHYYLNISWWLWKIGAWWYHNWRQFGVEFSRRPFPVRVDLVQVPLQWGHLCLYGTYQEGGKSYS